MCTRFAKGFKSDQSSIEVENFNQFKSIFPKKVKISPQNMSMRLCNLIGNYGIDSCAFYHQTLRITNENRT